MKAKLGLVVESDFGTGPIVAMSRDWCIHTTLDGKEEYAVLWEDIIVTVEAPDVPLSAASEGPELRREDA